MSPNISDTLELEHTKRKYLNTLKYLKHIQQSGKIRRLTRSQINAIRSRIKRCLEFIRRFTGLSALTAAIIAIGNVDMDAQCRMNRLPISNQSTFRTTIGQLSPTFVDIDNDGDLDLVIGYYSGPVNTYINDNGFFKKAYGALNPFDGVGIYVSRPTFVDIDDDGDPDAFIASGGGNMHFFRNTNGIFVEETGNSNPLNGVRLGERAKPTFVDIDDDGDSDAIIGIQDGTIHFYKNTNGSLNEVTGSENPFNGEDVGIAASPTFVDIDNDDDPDAFIGKSDGTIDFFRNNNGIFTEETGSANLLNGVDVGFSATPTFADIDNDGDPDAFIGESGHRLHFFRNDGGTFNEVIDSNNPFYDIDVDTNAAPCLVDLDNDNDDDLIIGSFPGKIRTFNNTNGVYTEALGTNNPFNGIDVGDSSKPVMVDIDNDNDQDLIVGSRDGKIHYFRNDDGVFVRLVGIFNPFNLIDVGLKAAPTFVDFDGDNDKDAFIGADDGTIHYFRNESGTFKEKFGTANPFNDVDVGESATPNFFLFSRSIAMVGNRDGEIKEFKKDGNKYVPVLDSALEGVDVGFTTTPIIRSNQVIVGNSRGHLFVYKDQGGRSNVWQGPFSSHWHGPTSNWDMMTIPKSTCDNVHIFQGSTLKIETSQTGKARTLSVRDGGQFEVKSGAELFINPD